MKKLSLVVALGGLLALPAFAQYPAGTPDKDRAAQPSTMGNPTPQEEVKTRKDAQGRTVTEDGRLVKPQPQKGEASTDPARHSAPGGLDDPSTDAGKLD